MNEKRKKWSKNYYNKNRNKQLQMTSDWIKRNPDRTKETRAKHRISEKEKGFQDLSSVKTRAKKKGLPFNLTKDYLRSITPTHCPVLGILLESGMGNKTDNSPSIDRIIPELGYVEGNVIIVSYKANRLRSDATPSELKQVADFYNRLLTSDQNT